MNTIKTKHTNILKRFLKFLFLKQISIFYLMVKLDCSYIQAKDIYKIYKNFYN